MSSPPVAQKAHEEADAVTPRPERHAYAPDSQRALRGWLLAQVIEFHRSGMLSPAEADGLRRALLGRSHDGERLSRRLALRELVAAALIALG